MSSYSELIKNFEKTRSYMRDFYVYGFKSREEYNEKSHRSYDDERRRIESWLDGYIKFIRRPDGKNVFISIDSRLTERNPLYKAWQAKSFTDGDITLHFILFDILYSPEISLTLSEILDTISSTYLNSFKEPLTFDESTVRKKLKEYENEGIIISKKEGKKLLYSRAKDISVTNSKDALDFFSEVAPCGVIGSFLLDKQEGERSVFGFKHHYITSAFDSGTLTSLFLAISEKRSVSLKYTSKTTGEILDLNVIPLKIFISSQSGRQYLISYYSHGSTIHTHRLDYISDVSIGEVSDKFDGLRKRLDLMQKHMWGINYQNNLSLLEHVEFTVRVLPGEEYIIKRLEREKRCGTITRLDKQRYRFTADVYSTEEMIPWIRTLICRIEDLDFSNKFIERRFKKDLEKMYDLYGLNDY